MILDSERVSCGKASGPRDSQGMAAGGAAGSQTAGGAPGGFGLGGFPGLGLGGMGGLGAAMGGGMPSKFLISGKDEWMGCFME